MTDPDRTTAEDLDSPAEVLTPIPGEILGPAPKPKPRAVSGLEQRARWARPVWPALARFKVASATLMAGGTAYYAFVAMFSLLAFAYGVTTLVSADEVADWMTRALEEALPGLVGDDGIDPATLERIGRTSSVVGLGLLVVSGSAVMVATSDSLRTIYGAGPDGRNPVSRRVHLIGWLAAIGPLIVVSYTLSTAAGGFGTELLQRWGVDSSVGRAAVLGGALVATLALDVAIMALLLGRLGGIRPPRRALLVGSLLGAIVITALKALMATIVAWSADKPQYGSFALPIAVLVVLWLQSTALYAAACLTAGVAEVQGGEPAT
ncbi:MAG: YihY/virulence factor BrkB family protein [Acidimicrobiales bacterium]|nr:YihY/virulence factor BrkB family protein [Acidimicrobiales bacterium]